MKYFVSHSYGCFASRLDFGLEKAFRDGRYATLSVESQTCPGSGKPVPLQVCTGPLNAQCEGESLEVVMVNKL